MTALAWDQPGERRYETGVDHGVLFLKNGDSAAWNGLTGVSDSTSRDAESFFIDGVKFLERQTRGQFAGTLKAFTYPDEFDQVNGVSDAGGGLFYLGQKPKAFSLSYRTKVGNDLQGNDLGYKIHIFYNVMTKPSATEYPTIDADTKAVEMSWELSSTPPVAYGYGPTAHIVIDSTKTDPVLMGIIEELIYGNADNDPWLPPIEVLSIIFNATDEVTIIDIGDGTWLALDLAGTHIVHDSPTAFTMLDVNATYLNEETYKVSNTP